jgi:signal transduction histidine kinase
MNWHFAYTPQNWPSLITVLFLMALSAYGWRRRNVPGALPFAFGCLFAALWAASSGMEYAAVDMTTKIFWFKVHAVWTLPTVVATTFFVLEYAWPGRWLTRRNIILMSIPCLLMLWLIQMDGLHHWLWHGFTYDQKLLPIRGPINWLIVIYAYGLTVLNLIVFVWMFLRSPKHRWPVAIMFTGQVVSRTLYLLEALQVPHFILPIEIPHVLFENLMYAIALFGFYIFDEVNLARQRAINQMREGMLVLDAQGKVVSLNPAAQAILDISIGRVLGAPVLDLLPEYAAVSGDFSDVGLNWVEISRETELESRDYILETSILQDWRGLVAGRLLLLYDVTDQKQAQAQHIEQQRAIAMLQERERLAREMHDSIGQVLGYAGFQVEAASKLARDGRVGAATAQLDRLAKIVRDAHADVREQILNLRTIPGTHQPFFTVVRDYLDGFTDNYSIQTLLDVDERLGDEPLPQDTQMQVFRIMQEALSNARKHGQARCVEVTFAMDNPFVRVTVQDNGAGFDSSQSTAGNNDHFGLQFMRERAEGLGGSLQVISEPGQGTEVVVRVPIKNMPSIQENEANDA